MSLNYDCVIDQALSTEAGFRFDPERGGYGVAVDSGATAWRRAGRGRRAKGSILLLKLHGSLNWRAGGPPLRLRAKPYDTVEAGVVAPPLTNKPVQDSPFRDIWREARTAVARMRRLIIIGYSMPDGDGLVRALLATDLSRYLEDVIIVDRSEETQQKHTGLFSRLAPDARVLSLKSFAHLRHLLQ